MFTIFVTIAITAVLTAIVTAGFCYLYLLCPTQQTRLYRNRAASLSEQLDLLRKSRATLASEQQADLETLQSDLAKWVEHECAYHKAPAVGDALNQRIKERLEVLLYFQKRRETQAQ